MSPLVRMRCLSLALCAWTTTVACRARPVALADRSSAATPSPSARPSLRELLDVVRAGASLTPTRWPDGAQAAVLLTFDFDAELATYGFGRTALSGMQWAPYASAGQFGARRGLSRLLALLAKRRVAATFFVPATVAELHPEAVRRIAAAGHELACHGDRHEDLQSLTSLAEERQILKRCIDVLSRFAKRPYGFRAPYGRLSPNTLRLVREAGFRWDSSLRADDHHPYRLVLDGRETRLVEIPLVDVLTDWGLFGGAQQIGPQTAPRAVYDIWRAEFDAAHAEGGVFTLTLHPQVMGRAHRVALLEELLTHMQQRGRLWFARASEVVAHLDNARSR